MATQNSEGVPKLNESIFEIIRIEAESITVSWTKFFEGVSNPSDYHFHLEWISQPDNTIKSLDFAGDAITQYTIPLLCPSTTYRLTIQSRLNNEWACDFTEKTVTTLPLVDQVPKLTQSTLEILRVDADKIIISWEKALEGVSNPKDFIFYISWNPDPNPDKEFGSDAFNGMKTKFTLTGLKPSTKYRINIVCVQNEQRICYTDKTVTTTESPTAPPLQIPTLDDSTVKITRIDAETIKVSWGKAIEGISNPEDYVFELVWYAKENNPNNTIYMNRLSNVTEYTITGLQPSIPYGVRINCYSVEGDERLARTDNITV